ncbi:258_t:CDS:2 [Acaulospora colombiana]|uniref:258_t:CDS:1 n=1 Tax=Acaulospora colombiana TaxID=27376 RepID=A0ACA9Q064_9GLOM|nr:258_t:CDS:2 [Acaulospora colombiana]
MNTSTSRSSTPSTPQIAPLLPPPPGSRFSRPAPSIDLLNERSAAATSATDNVSTSSGMGDLASLIGNGKSTSGGLSAQDLSFFEGL